MIKYKYHEWVANEHITTSDLNNIENGIVDIYAVGGDLEKKDNKITTGILTENNTHTQYPSVKVVWDSFQKVGEDNLTQYKELGLSNEGNALINVNCYFDDKITIKNLNNFYLIDNNNNLVNKPINISELIFNFNNFNTYKGLNVPAYIFFKTSISTLHETQYQFISKNSIQYIEPNYGKIIKNETTVHTYADLCARPPRKMKFVSLNENDTTYKNGVILTINEIRDNLIFYAQDGYEWTYEQDGQTKKYADFLSNSDFSFENGEQSIQLQITDDNALSESQNLTINCNKTYGPSDFLQTINFSINVPIIVNRTQISNIRLYAPPTQRVYLKGKDTKAVYTGLQIQLIDEDNNVWSSSNYPNGIIPFSELSITNLNINSLTQEEDTETYHGYDITWTSPSLVDENNTPITMNISVGNDNQNYRLMVSTYHAKTMEIDTTNAITEYNSGDTISKTGLNIIIKDSRGQPYIGLTNGKPNSIDILINPTVATASDDIDYGKFESQNVTVSWIDSYNNNNNNKIENTYQITVNKPYKPWIDYSKNEAITILQDIQNNKINIEQLDITDSNYYLIPVNTNYKTFLNYGNDITTDLLPNTNNYFKSTDGEIKAILVFDCGLTKMSNSISSTYPWKNCDLQKWLNTTFLNTLPSELQQLLKPISLVSSNYSNNINTTTNKINLFSIFELYQITTLSYDTKYSSQKIISLTNEEAIMRERAAINTPFPEAEKILGLLHSHEGNNTSGVADMWTRTAIAGYVGYTESSTKTFAVVSTSGSAIRTEQPNTQRSFGLLFAAI